MARRKPDDFDILTVVDRSQVNGAFAVSFDFECPRAHFVISSRIKERWEDIAQMNEAEQKQVLATAKGVAKALKLQQATLSIHRGSWITSRQSQYHVCTDVVKYLQVFDSLKSRAPMSDWWPSNSCVTRQWKASQDPSHYAENVRGYPHGNFKNEEIREIRGTRATGDGLRAFKGKALVYHSEARWIGVAGNFAADVNGMYELFRLLEDLSVQLGISKKSLNGCHVCLDLTGRGYDGFVTSDPENEPVQGYLQVSGAIMYKNCPREQRDKWFENYRSPNFDDKVYT